MNIDLFGCLLTHICHWNVRGPNFFALHTALEAQYTELFTAIDEIAEPIRALGSLAPGGLANLAKVAGIEEIAEDSSPQEMVNHLLALNGKLVKDLSSARDLASEEGDSQTEDMMIARIQRRCGCWKATSHNQRPHRAKGITGSGGDLAWPGFYRRPL